MRGSSPSVERVACGSSLFASGAVTVSLYLLAGSVRTRGHRESLRVLGGAALPQDANRRGAGAPAQQALPARARWRHHGNSPTPRGSRRLRLGPAPRWDMHSHMHGSSAKLVGSCDGGRVCEACMGPGAPGEVSPRRRRRSARIFQPRRRRAACGGPGPRDGLERRGSGTALE